MSTYHTSSKNKKSRIFLGEVDAQDLVSVKPEAGATMAANLIPSRDENAQKPSDIYRVEHLLTGRYNPNWTTLDS